MSEEGVTGGDGADGDVTGGDGADREATGGTVIDGITIEPATPDDRLDVLRVLDAAMLETDAEAVAERIGAGDVLVARFDRTGVVVGALVAVRHGSESRSTRDEPDGDPSIDLHVDAVAVRRARRGRGIGSTLVERAVERAEDNPETDRVTAEFDASLAGFYTGLGFETEHGSSDAHRPDHNADRLRGTRSVADPS